MINNLRVPLINGYYETDVKQVITAARDKWNDVYFFYFKDKFDNILKRQKTLLRQNNWQLVSLPPPGVDFSEKEVKEVGYSFSAHKNGQLYNFRIRQIKEVCYIGLSKSEPSPFKVGDIVEFKPPLRYVAEAEMHGPPPGFIGKVTKVNDYFYIIVEGKHPHDVAGGWPWTFFKLVKTKEEAEKEKKR